MVDDPEFAGKKLRKGVEIGIFKEIRDWEVEMMVGEGDMVQSLFVVWQIDGADKKSSFTIKFILQSKH